MQQSTRYAGRSGRPTLDALQFQLLDAKALKLLDFFWAEHQYPLTLKTNASTTWMRESGMSNRGEFFRLLEELEAHRLITVTAEREPGSKKMRGLSIQLRFPPETVPESAFDLYEQRLVGDIERRLDRLNALRKLRDPSHYQPVSIREDTSPTQAAEAGAARLSTSQATDLTGVRFLPEPLLLSAGSDHATDNSGGLQDPKG